MRCTIFVLVIFSNDKMILTLLTKFTFSLVGYEARRDNLHICLVGYEARRDVSKICEQCYYHNIGWRNDQNKMCRSWEVIKICIWQVLYVKSSCDAKVCLNF